MAMPTSRDEESDDDPAERDHPRATGEAGEVVRGRTPGQDRDDREADREVGEPTPSSVRAPGRSPVRSVGHDRHRCDGAVIAYPPQSRPPWSSGPKYVRGSEAALVNVGERPRRRTCYRRAPTWGKVSEMACEIDDLLDRVPGWAGQARTVTPLEGGITNRNLLVDVDGESFVVRAPGQGHRPARHRPGPRAGGGRSGPPSSGSAPRSWRFLEPEGCSSPASSTASPAESLADRAPQLGRGRRASLRRVPRVGPAHAGRSTGSGSPRTTRPRRGEHGRRRPRRLRPGAWRWPSGSRRRSRGARAAVPCHNDLLAGQLPRAAGGGSGCSTGSTRA